jgi:hypothetical protein
MSRRPRCADFVAEVGDDGLGGWREFFSPAPANPIPRKGARSAWVKGHAASGTHAKAKEQLLDEAERILKELGRFENEIDFVLNPPRNRSPPFPRSPPELRKHLHVCISISTDLI